MINYIIKNYFLSIFLISILVIFSAYIMEFFFNYPPCKLCLYQRIPYFILILLSIVSYIIKPKVIFYYLAGLSILTNLLILDEIFCSSISREISSASCIAEGIVINFCFSNDKSFSEILL